jgi:hypothetical protein
MRLIIGVLCALLAGCGGSDGSSSAGAVQNVPRLDIQEASDGCIIESNEETSFEYLISGNLVKHSVWNCVGGDSQRVEIFSEYDTTKGCFVKSGMHTDSGKCGVLAVAPVNPALEAHIADEGFAGSMERYGISYHGQSSGDHQFAIQFDPRIENNGNVTAFDLTLTAEIEGRHLNHYTLPADQVVITLVSATENRLPVTMASWKPLGSSHYMSPYFSNPFIQSGSIYNVKLTLKDKYGGILDEKTIPAKSAW